MPGPRERDRLMRYAASPVLASSDDRGQAPVLRGVQAVAAVTACFLSNPPPAPKAARRT